MHFWSSSSYSTFIHSARTSPVIECSPHPHLGLRRLPAPPQPCWFSQYSHPWQIFWSRRTPLTHLLEAIYNMLCWCPSKVLVVKSISIWLELHESEHKSAIELKVISPMLDCQFLLVFLSPLTQRIPLNLFFHNFSLSSATLYFVHILPTSLHSPNPFFSTIPLLLVCVCSLCEHGW